MRLLKWLSVVCFVLLSLSNNVYAQKANTLNTSNVNIVTMIQLGCEGTNCAGLTVDATAGGVTLTSSKYNPVVADQPSAFSQAQLAICTNSGAKIWYTANSSITLASGDGQPAVDGTTFNIYGFINIQNFKAIRDAAVSSTLRCDYYRQQ